MIIRATRRLIVSGVLVGIVSLSSGCGLQSARPSFGGADGEGWDFGQVTSSDGHPVTDSGARPILAEGERGYRPGSRIRFKPEPGAKDSADLWGRIRSGFAIPPQDHPAIDADVDWFVRNQSFLDRTTQRARPYLHYIVDQVESRGVPSEIALLPVVESAFQPFAHSPARASGIWQFIPETGRRFGLRQNWWYDGRRDVLASTRAALDYLTTLRDQFGGDWLLAVAAYNCGEGAVGRAIQENQRKGLPTDFWNLSLPEETRSYVPRLLALSRVVASPSAYGLQLATVPNQPYITRVSLDGPVDLNVAASVAGIPLADLRHLNPGFSRWATDPDGPHHLVLPIHKADEFSARLRDLPDHERLPWKRHVVRRGETLAMLASRYGTTADTLREANQLADGRVRPGNVVRVPLSARATGTSVMLAEASETLTQPASRAAGDGASKERRAAPVLKVSEPAAVTQKYVVRPGETLYSLARRYGVTPQALASLNGISPQAGVKVGQTLKVRAGTERTAVASAEPAPVKAAAERVEKAATAAPVPAKGPAPEKVASAPARSDRAETSRPAPAKTTAQAAKAGSGGEPIRYKVKPGESLWGISQRFGVSVAMLRRWNNLGEKQAVQAGQELNVYREDTRVARAG
jgi:membrane-bound lytic murein transglycosylase D